MNRGEFCENLVAQYFIQKGLTLLAQRRKIAKVEVDLVFESKPGQVIICEVKSVSSWEGFVQTRISFKQRQRLERVVEYLNASGCEATLIFALVDHQNKIEIVGAG